MTPKEEILQKHCDKYSTFLHLQEGNNIIDGSADSAFEAMEEYAKQQNEELIDILTDLVQIKEWKDKNGKDEHYLKLQPFTWARAKLALLNAKTNQT